MTATVELSDGGWRVEFYIENARGEGMVAYWYGTREQCQSRAGQPGRLSDYFFKPVGREPQSAYARAETSLGEQP